MQRAAPAERERMKREMEGARAQGQQSWTAIHLLSAEEAESLFQDVVEGLGFLVRFHSVTVLEISSSGRGSTINRSYTLT